MEYVDPEKVPIHVALARVMADVKAVGKSGYNSHQNYNFRGIDGVMNGVGPALRTPWCAAGYHDGLVEA
ncbi:ERF family protein [Corynebacterium renale]|uniref:ERF family protein n=1 Tax=Corynebacterium renale TaxID=1724 RepID=UPI000DF87C08|nr:ERF family protein [Corynebacterium renale]STD70275.1 Uncharacterised protein [Corynebacterium renale]